MGISRLPKEKQDANRPLLLAGAAMLYGSAREVLTMVTDSHLWGPFVLPTVSPQVFLRAAAQKISITQNG